ncbi:MAG: hypothetical protein ACREI3_08675 [Nitrospirales bacterium]
MRHILALGSAILFVGFASMAIAQERLPQASGFGTGVGESGGVGTRSQIWDRNALLERLDQPETLYGRVMAIDLPGKKIHLETGGSSHDEGRAGLGAMSEVRVYLNDASNLEALKSIKTGDDVIVTAREETTKDQPYGTGKKFLLDMSVLRGNEELAGFGGLGQRPDPATERGIVTQNASTHGGIIGQVLPGEVQSGVHSEVGTMTGAAPCWQCAPQPGWGYEAKESVTDYGSAAKPDFTKE